MGKVRGAARYLAEAGGDGLARFKGKGSEYVWKDTYVFVADCNKRTIVAHPTMPSGDGRPIADGPTYGGVTAAQRADAQCAAAGKPGGGWFKSPFPKPGEERPSRKVALHAGRARDAVRGRGGGLRRDSDPRAAAGAQRRAALDPSPVPGGEAAPRPRRACRAHASGSPCKVTSAASASASGAGGNVATKQPRPCSRDRPADACSGLTRAGPAPNLRAAVPETGPRGKPVRASGLSPALPPQL